MKAALYLLLLPCLLTAQTSIDGLWEGTMTVGGIYSNEALPMQLHITTTEDSIHGRSYVTLPDGEILRMELKGQLYGDRSFTLTEVSFAGDEHNGRDAPLQSAVPDRLPPRSLEQRATGLLAGGHRSYLQRTASAGAHGVAKAKGESSLIDSAALCL